MRLSSCILLLVTSAWASPDIVLRASALYQSTDYTGSLRVLEQDPAPDAAGYLLSGKNYFMSGDYKKAIEFFEKALAISPANSEYELWLGRAWGRRAETGGWLMAASHASKARQCFEKAVALDPGNREAKNDLFTFYLNAPGFLGGGMDKAEAAAKSIAHERPAQYEFEEAANRRPAKRLRGSGGTPAPRRGTCANRTRPGARSGAIPRQTGASQRKRSAVRAGQKNGSGLTQGGFRRSQCGYRKPSQHGTSAYAP